MPVLTKMQWLFCHTAVPEWLITSDNPVTLRVPSHPEWGYGLARRDIHVQFPASREVCLWAMWGKEPDMHLDLPAPVEAEDGQRHELPVSAANILTMAYADKIIISASPKFPGAEMLPHKAGLPAFFNYIATEEGAPH